MVGEEFIAYACNITFGSNKNEIQQRCPTEMVFYGQDTGCKLQENHDELGVLLPLKEFEHNILDHLEQVDLSLIHIYHVKEIIDKGFEHLWQK